MSSYGHFGLNVACSDHSALLDQIENIVAEASNKGFDTYYATQKARTYLDRFSLTNVSIFHNPYPVLPTTCRKEVAAAKEVFNSVATMLKNAGIDTGPIYDRDQLIPPSEAPQDITGTIKTVAIAAGIIAGALVLLPIIKEVVFVRKAARKLSGRRNRR